MRVERCSPFRDVPAQRSVGARGLLCLYKPIHMAQESFSVLRSPFTVQAYDGEQRLTQLDRIKGMTTQIAAVDADLDQALAELDMLRHLEDDAVRDALVSEGWDDKVDAKRAKRDVARCDKRIKGLESDRVKLVTRRTAMIDRLAAQ